MSQQNNKDRKISYKALPRIAFLSLVVEIFLPEMVLHGRVEIPPLLAVIGDSPVFYPYSKNYCYIVNKLITEEKFFRGL
ncbi:MAG: hypothetical protein ACTS73_09230 [Arsenophonus sp. NEOnobi-MAG3]